MALYRQGHAPFQCFLFKGQAVLKLNTPWIPLGWFSDDQPEQEWIYSWHESQRRFLVLSWQKFGWNKLTSECDNSLYHCETPNLWRISTRIRAKLWTFLILNFIWKFDHCQDNTSLSLHQRGREWTLHLSCCGQSGLFIFCLNLDLVMALVLNIERLSSALSNEIHGCVAYKTTKCLWQYQLIFYCFSWINEFRFFLSYFKNYSWHLTKTNFIWKSNNQGRESCKCCDATHGM